MNYNFDEVHNRKGTYSTQWDFISDRFGRNDILPFSISDTDFCVPKPVTEALKKAVELEIFGYTRWNHDAFKQAIVQYFKRRFDTEIDADSIVYSPSVMYTLSSLIELLSEVGDAVATFAPMYTDFEDCTRLRQRRMLRVYLDNHDSVYTINWQKLEEALAQAKIFLLCSPHNPTGRVWTNEELSKLVDLCQKYQVQLISDEIHMDIVLKGKHIPIMRYIQNYPNIYLISSGSKTFNYPGLGGSYALLANPKVRDCFLNHTKHRDFVNSANYMGMTALMSSYCQCDDYVDELVGYIQKNMDLVDTYIHQYCAPLKFRKPEGTYLAWIDCRDLPVTADEFQDVLVNIGQVGIMKGETYFGDGYLRMNVGCPNIKLKDGLQRLKKSIDYLKKNKCCDWSDKS